jgi:hypothetical protein
MRTILFPNFVCRIMPSHDNALAVLSAMMAPNWSDRGLRFSLQPELPDGDPLERPTSLPDYPTDVPAPQPHDVPAWEPVDDPPPDPGQPQPKPRPIP